MPKYWETKEFKELNSAYEQLLKSTGFADAEKTVGDKRVLVQQSSNAYRQAPAIVRQAKKAYFDMLMKCVANETFSDEVDKLVMTRRSEGVSIKTITDELETLNRKQHRQTIRFIIRKYEEKWNIKKYQPNQLRANR